MIKKNKELPPPSGPGLLQEFRPPSVRFGVGRDEDFGPRPGPAWGTGHVIPALSVNNRLSVATVFFTVATLFLALFANFQRILSCSGVS